MSIDSDTFVDAVTEAFDISDGNLALDTQFKTLEQWDSLASVSTVAMVYANYDVQISGNELVGCTTVADILELVTAKLPATA